MKPWRTEVGMGVGLVVGLLVWWSAHEEGRGLAQNLNLIVVAPAFGFMVVYLRNRRLKHKRVEDPE
jgi:hypothetical protein